MLVAPSKPAEPEWKTVMGAQVLFAPIDRPMLRRARRVAVASLGEDRPETDDEATLAEQLADLGDALSHALLMAGILDWRDVCVMVDDEDTGSGEPLPCDDDAKARVLADPLVFEAFDAAYVVPFASRERERAAPGKGSPPSPGGTGAEVKAVSDTAPSPAMASAADVTSAPTSSTKRKPRRKMPSGTS